MSDALADEVVRTLQRMRDYNGGQTDEDLGGAILRLQTLRAERDAAVGALSEALAYAEACVTERTATRERLMAAKDDESAIERSVWVDCKRSEAARIAHHLRALLSRLNSRKGGGG